MMGTTPTPTPTTTAKATTKPVVSPAIKKNHDKEKDDENEDKPCRNNNNQHSIRSLQQQQQQQQEQRVQEEALLVLWMSRFDPLLRMLCQALRDYDTINNQQQQVERQRTGVVRSRVVGLLRTISELLDQLQKRLLLQLQVVHPADQEEATSSLPRSSSSTSGTLAVPQQRQQKTNIFPLDENLVEYISIPLLNVLRHFSGGVVPSSQQQDKDKALLRSLQWQCVERASRALRTVVVEWMGINRRSTTDDDRASSVGLSRSASSSSPVVPRLLERYIWACVNALPNTTPDDDQDKDRHRTSPTCTATRGLDLGHDCSISLWETIQAIVLVVAGTTQTSYITSDYGILAGIVDAGIRTLEPPVETSNTMDSRRMSPPYRLQEAILSTLTTLQQSTTVTNVLFWRRSFPGIYTGLYRRLLGSLRVSHVDPHAKAIVVKSVQCLVRLLVRTLQQPSSSSSSCPEQQHSSSSPQHSSSPGAEAVEQFRAWQLTANKKNSNQNNNHAASSSFNADRRSSKPPERVEQGEEESHFFAQVEDRVPSTLTVLIHMLTAAGSGEIRRQAVELDRILLVDTYWKDRSVRSAALESCLMLSQDTADPEVASRARAALPTLLNNNNDKNDYDANCWDTVVAPRVVELLDRIPSLVHSTTATATELQACCKLVSAYLEYAASSQQDARKVVRSALVTAAATIRKAFGVLYDVDFESVEPNHPSGSFGTALVVPEEDKWRQGSMIRPPWRYISHDETQEASLNVIQAVGTLLGPKHVTILVDACLADMYESCVGRVERRVSLEGHSQVQWVHEWIGTLVMVQKMIESGFVSTDEPDHPVSQKREIRRLRFLGTLADSILSVITTFPLWNLPTRASSQPESRPLPKTHSVLLSSDKEESSLGIVATALRGNAVLSFALLGVIRSLVNCLGPEAQRYVPTILYPILEKAGHFTVRLVRDSALHTLQTLASAVGLTDMSNLISGNMESSVMGTIFVRIRTPGGRALIPGEAIGDDLLSIVESATTVFRIIANARDRDPRLKGASDCQSMLACVEELTQQLIKRFDHASKRTASDTSISMSYLLLFDAALQLLRTFRETETETSDESPQEPWFELLAPYRVETEPELSAEEGFARHLKEKKAASANCETKDGTGLSRDTDFVALVMWRCGYLLSHPRLEVQTRSCEVIETGFRFLGWAYSYLPSESEANGPRTAVLRQVHALWTTIDARIKAMVTSLRKCSLIEITSRAGQQVQENVGVQRIFLSKLFDLVSTMTECSDDFMVSRFRRVIWPRLHAILASYGACGRQSVDARDKEQISVVQNGIAAESERGLVLASLKCLSRVFAHRPTGIQLLELIPGIGAVLFPFLDQENDLIVSECMEAVRNMLRIDCDSLWKQLVEMSGEALPPRPIELPNSTRSPGKDEKQITNRPNRCRVVSEKCRRLSKELILFIQSLPEQTLD